jgi:hypothetical protein
MESVLQFPGRFVRKMRGRTVCDIYQEETGRSRPVRPSLTRTCKEPCGHPSRSQSSSLRPTLEPCRDRDSEVASRGQ